MYRTYTESRRSQKAYVSAHAVDDEAHRLDIEGVTIEDFGDPFTAFSVGTESVVDPFAVTQVDPDPTPSPSTSDPHS